MYANILGSIDLWMIGMIGCRLMHYLPVHVSPKKIIILRTVAAISLLVLATVFSGWIKELGSFSNVFSLMQTGLNQVYKVGSIFFGITSIALVILYSYREDNSERRKSWSKTVVGAFCNAVAPYTFMFYLWHSGLLTQVARKLAIEEPTTHYWAMLLIGFIVTSYVAYLMTQMNNGIIKNILKK